MQLEDEELGLGTSSAAGHTPAIGDHSERAPPVASTSRSPSPSRYEIATAEDAAALAESLADLVFSTNGGGDGARSGNDDDDEAEADWTAPTAAPTKKSKKKQRKKVQVVPGFDDEDDDDVEALGGSGHASDVDLTDVIGMAPSGGRRKNQKGKGRQGARVGSSRVAEGDDVAGAMSVPDQAGTDDEAARSTPVKNGTSRSRARSPPEPRSGADLEEEDGQEPTPGSDADEAKSSTQLSKKEKRRLKEAAKKAAASGGGATEEVVVRGARSLISLRGALFC